jgi:pimeloyl-ACP methyl ester carboxylesterase
VALVVTSFLFGPACRPRDDKSRSVPAPPVSSASLGLAPPAVSSAPAPVPPAARVEEVEVPGDLPVFVVRGKRGGERLVFIHGLCGHPLAYAHSFRQAAARVGTMIALQGNVSCGPGYRDWSCPPAKVDERIEAAFRALGDQTELRDLIVIGYSSGGTFAELLVMRNPERYTRAILIANPRRPAFYRLKSLRAAVMMAGQRDRHDLMKGGDRDLKSRGIPSTFMVLPGATHGEMGNDAERVMAEALRWLKQNERPGANP